MQGTGTCKELQLETVAQLGWGQQEDCPPSFLLLESFEERELAGVAGNWVLSAIQKPLAFGTRWPQEGGGVWGWGEHLCVCFTDSSMASEPLMSEDVLG